jgi:hypothetical protein
MMRRTKRGQMALLIGLALGPVALLMSTWLQAAWLRSAEQDLSRALSAQVRSTLSQFDPDYRSFGLFGFKASAIDDRVFTAMLPAALRNCTCVPDAQLKLTDPVVLDHQIIRYMKGRLPAVYLQKLFSSLSSARSGLESSALAGQNQLAGLDLPASDVQSALSQLFGDTLDRLQDQVLLRLQDFYQQYAPTIAGSSSDSGIGQILGQKADLFDPAAVSAMAGHLDRLLGFETDPVYEKLCLTEYILGQFRPQVESINRNGSREDLRTIDGRRFKDWPENRQCEVEMILTGLDRPDEAKTRVELLLTSLRSLIHLFWILSDAGQMAEIRSEATALSASLLVISSGMTPIDPDILVYLLVIGRAVGNGLMDYDCLATGQAVDLWPGATDFPLPFYYQDYLRLILFMIPRATLLERAGRQLERILPSPCFTRLAVTASYRGKNHSLAGGYP